MSLSVKEKMTLDLEAVQWNMQGSKDVEIRYLFDEHAATYYARLNHLLDQPEAVEYAPMVVHRLRRLRDQRRAVRSARRLTSPVGG